jgi:hypothetical protein
MTGGTTIIITITTMTGITVTTTAITTTTITTTGTDRRSRTTSSRSPCSSACSCTNTRNSSTRAALAALADQAAGANRATTARADVMARRHVTNATTGGGAASMGDITVATCRDTCTTIGIGARIEIARQARSQTSFVDVGAISRSRARTSLFFDVGAPFRARFGNHRIQPMYRPCQ